MKILQNIVSVISAIILTAAAALFAQMLIGIRPYVVMSGSMEPSVHTGAVVFVNTKADPDECHVGDIIVFPKGDNTVSHRIVSEEDGAFITKGDANPADDAGPVPKGEVKGRVIYSIPYVGYIIVALRSPTGIAALLFFALLYLVISVLFDKLKLKEECRNAEKN